MLEPHTIRILCVDDDVQGCEMISEFLRHHNSLFNVISVFDAAEALRALAVEKFDLYLIDNWLPGDSGIDLCQMIRRTDTTTPIIIYSAVAGKADVQEGLDAGANAYLTKPNDLMNVGPTIERLIASKPDAYYAV